MLICIWRAAYSNCVQLNAALARMLNAALFYSHDAGKGVGLLFLKFPGWVVAGSRIGWLISTPHSAHYRPSSSVPPWDVPWPMETNIQLSGPSAASSPWQPFSPHRTSQFFFFFFFPFTSTFPEGWFWAWQLAIQLWELLSKHFKVKLWQTAICICFPPFLVFQETRGEWKRIQNSCPGSILELISLVNYHNAWELFFWEAWTIIISWPFHCCLLIYEVFQFASASYVKIPIRDCHYNKNKGLSVKLITSYWISCGSL